MDGGIEKVSKPKDVLYYLQGESVTGRTLFLPNELQEIVTKISKEFFRGLIVAFNLEGKILYTNERIRFLTGIERLSPREWGFFEYIPKQHKEDVVRMFYEVYIRRKGIEKISCHVPLLVGSYEISSEQIRGDLLTFPQGLLLKIPDNVLVKIKEMELEKLKLLLLKHPNTGLWVTDKDGTIVDVLHTNCEANLGWKSFELLGSNLYQYGHDDLSEEVYSVERPQKDGGSKKTEGIKGECCFSNGKTYFIYLDTYFDS